MALTTRDASLTPMETCATGGRRKTKRSSRSARIAWSSEYGKFSPVEGANLNGRLTLGENGADNAGIRLHYMALLGGIENGSVDKNKLDNFTPPQRFFLGYAQIWCENQRPESVRQRVRTDPALPGEFRTLGVLQNVPEFASALRSRPANPWSQPTVAESGRISRLTKLGV